VIGVASPTIMDYVKPEKKKIEW